MKKLEKDMDVREFLQMIMNKYPSLHPCLNCPHPNGECVEFAKQGKCRAYD